jgi:hypothetical protein
MRVLKPSCNLLHLYYCNFTAEKARSMDSRIPALMQQQLLVQQQLHDTNARLDKFLDLLQELKADVKSIKDANKSTSTSGIRYNCPMNCGADFKKVRVQCNCSSWCNTISGQLFAGSFIPIAWNQQ